MFEDHLTDHGQVLSNRQNTRLMTNHAFTWLDPQFYYDRKDRYIIPPNSYSKSRCRCEGEVKQPETLSVILFRQGHQPIYNLFIG
jgi:hypothetical protein